MGWWPFRKKARENTSLIRSSGRRGEGIEEDPPAPSSNTPSDEERETVASFPEYEISEWLEIIGYGRYQIYVTLFVGIVAFADIAELAVTAVIIKAIGCEWDLSSLEKGILGGMIMLGEAAGSLVCGKLADIYGRWKIMIIMVYVIVISSIIAICAQSYYMYLVVRTTAGFGIGGAYIISTCYIHEFSQIDKRATGLTTSYCIGETGAIYTCVCAVFIMVSLPNQLAWRVELVAVLLPTLLLFVLIHFADESPRFLAITNQGEAAYKVLERIARVNGVQLPDGTVRISVEERGEYLDVFKAPYTRMSIILSIVNFSVMYVLNGLYYFIPDVMTYGYCTVSTLFQSTYVSPTGCILYTQAQYIFFVILHCCSIPAIILGGVSTEQIGRVWSLISSSWISFFITLSLILCLFSIVTLIELVLVLMMMYLDITVVWIFAPEIYPTYMRTTTTGVLNAFNRVGAAAGCFVTEYVDDYDFMISLYCYMSVLAVSALSTLFTRHETRGEYLIDQRDDVTIAGSVNAESSMRKERMKSLANRRNVEALSTTHYGATDRSPQRSRSQQPANAISRSPIRNSQTNVLLEEGSNL